MSNKPGSLCEIVYIVRTSSDGIVDAIESLLRKLCLSTGDPFVSNKALYAVQSIREDRGEGEDRQLISDMIANEEKMLDETYGDRLASNN